MRFFADNEDYRLAVTEYIEDFDYYVRKLKKVYPPPHPAVLIAKEVRAILSTSKSPTKNQD